MLPLAAVMAIVGFLETMAVGGKFAMQARYDYDPNQELIALGLSNTAGAVMSAYPTTGSFSRTAVNAMFGATSLVSCAISSLIVLLAVYLLLPVVALLPLASLAPIIIQGAIGVIDFHGFKVAFKSSKSEFFVMLATFGVSLGLTVKEGLLVGFAASVLKTMHELANPNLAVCGQLPDRSFRDMRNFPNAAAVPGTVVVRMDARLNYANARKLKAFCLKAVQVMEEQGEKIAFVVIDCKSINHIDLTGCETLEMLCESLHTSGQQLVLANLKGPASQNLTAAGAPELLRRHRAHLCIDMESAMDVVSGAKSSCRQTSKTVEGLVQRVQSARQVLRSSRSSSLACVPQAFCLAVEEGMQPPAVQASEMRPAELHEAEGAKVAEEP
jgi:SulP family sulfate permease